LKLPPALFERLRQRQNTRDPLPARGSVRPPASAGAPAGEQNDERNIEADALANAVRLHDDGARSFHLTADGRLFAVDARGFEPSQEDDLPVSELGAPDSYSALVAGARALSTPELLELLPARCSSSAECDRCLGQRHVEVLLADAPARFDAREQDAPPRERIMVVCPLCSGLGWTFTPLTVDVVSAGFLGAIQAEQSQDWEFVWADGVRKPQQFCRVAMSRAGFEMIVIIVNDAPRVPEASRAALSVVLAEKYPRSGLAFIDHATAGQVTLSGASGGPSFAAAVAACAFMTVCGWDESPRFQISIDGFAYGVRMHFAGGKWHGSAAAPESVA
jgi:hypothetical protein